ncbi:MAG: hypothetical protein C7B43_13520 [Sulfobacillus benefaciens]|uniref:Uncharacterized protein n=1 Tax=Sulfobacillus benefaciens TaxID=453960 RepID=A0A2T2WWK4_9FIRM|nr:MAG: hypothetical protein C7B43_13520 [Sulfobacillus benefaciens]HBQ95988.1 hypothetical protein [Sulfobacillus sp.]
MIGNVSWQGQPISPLLKGEETPANLLYQLAYLRQLQPARKIFSSEELRSRSQVRFTSAINIMQRHHALRCVSLQRMLNERREKRNAQNR